MFLTRFLLLVNLSMISAIIVDDYGSDKVNSVDIKPKKRAYPFFVAILKSKENQGVPFQCGSSLFHPIFAVTSCQCVASYHHIKPNTVNGTWDLVLLSTKHLYGLAGSQNLITVGKKAQMRDVGKLHKHPRCKVTYGSSVRPKIVSFNVGVYQFTKAFEPTKDVGFIKMVDPYSVAQAESEMIQKDSRASLCFIAGFGETLYQEGKPENQCCTSDHLRHVWVLPKDGHQCAVLACRSFEKSGSTAQRKCQGTDLLHIAGIRCALFHAKAALGYSDSGGPFTCNILGLRYFFGVVSESSHNSNNSTMEYIPMSVVYPYIKSFHNVTVTNSVPPQHQQLLSFVCIGTLTFEIFFFPLTPSSVH